MAFVKGDPNINYKGRPTADKLNKSKLVQGEELREKEFKQILRRLKPLTTKAIVKLEDLIVDDKTAETTRMRAIAFVITEYEKLMNEVYKPNKVDDNEVDKDEIDTAPIISLKVLEK